MSTKKDEVIMLELRDRRQSNVFQDGTDNNPIFLDAPNFCWIPNEGMRLNEVTNKLEKIRFLENDTSILVEDQDARKVLVDKTKNKITFEKGLAYLYVSQNTEHLIEYIKTALYCGSSKRPKNCQATILYDVVDLAKKAEQVNEGEKDVVEALSILYKLKNKKDGLYVYNEEKIELYSNLLSVYGGETTAEKFNALILIAKTRPIDFISLVSTFDNTIKEEVGQAIKMDIISVTDGVASFSDGDKIIKPFPQEIKTSAQKIEFIADYLRTPEAAELLTEMRVRVDSKKQQKLANK